MAEIVGNGAPLGDSDRDRHHGHCEGGAEDIAGQAHGRWHDDLRGVQRADYASTGQQQDPTRLLMGIERQLQASGQPMDAQTSAALNLLYTELTQPGSTQGGPKANFAGPYYGDGQAQAQMIPNATPGDAQAIPISYQTGSGSPDGSAFGSSTGSSPYSYLTNPVSLDSGSAGSQSPYSYLTNPSTGAGGYPGGVFTVSPQGDANTQTAGQPASQGDNGYPGGVFTVNPQDVTPNTLSPTPQGDATQQPGQNPAPQGDAGTQTGTGKAALSQNDIMSMLSVWASANKMNVQDQNAYAQIGVSASDGKSPAVGPFQLDANAIGNWLGSFVNQQGQLDPTLLNQAVQSQEISQQTAQMLQSPQFMTFMQAMANGQQVQASDVQQFLPPELQLAIASDTLQAYASQQQGGTLDPGVVIAEAQLGRQLTSSDNSNQGIQTFVSSIDSTFSGQASPNGQQQGDTTPQGGNPQAAAPQQGDGTTAGANTQNVPTDTGPPNGVAM